MAVQKKCPTTTTTNSCCCLSLTLLLETLAKNKWLCGWMDPKKSSKYFLFLVTIILVIVGYHVQTRWSTTKWIAAVKRSRAGMIEQSFTPSPIQTQRLVQAEESCYTILHIWASNVLESRGRGMMIRHDNNDPNLPDEDNRFFELVQQYLEDYEDSTAKLSRSTLWTGQAQNVAEAVSTNPLAVFRMFRRFSSLLLPLSLDQFPSKSFTEFTETLTHTVGWPKEDHVFETILQILKLQHDQHLTATDISNGKLQTGDSQHVPTQLVTLTPQQCYEFGVTAFKNDYYTFSLEWLQLAAKKLGDDDPVLRSQIENTLQQVVLKNPLGQSQVLQN